MAIPDAGRGHAVHYMYVPIGSPAANSTDSRVQARTAPETAGRSTAATWLTNTGKEDAVPLSQIVARPWFLKHTTGVARPVHIDQGKAMAFREVAVTEIREALLAGSTGRPADGRRACRHGP